MDTVALGKLDGPLELDFSLLLHLRLVTDKVYLDIFRRMLLYLLKPVNEVCKCLIPGDIISQEHAVGTSVKDSCHRSEGFLTGLRKMSKRYVVLTVSQIWSLIT